MTIMAMIDPGDNQGPQQRHLPSDQSSDDDGRHGGHVADQYRPYQPQEKRAGAQGEQDDNAQHSPVPISMCVSGDAPDYERI